MKSRMNTSPAARDLIKRFEPFRADAQQDATGRWVVGYGHRAAAKAGVRVTEDEAALLLIYDVMRAEEVVDDSITGPLSRGQRDALTSFVHDIGVDRFRGSDVARYLFEGRARAAGEALAAYGDGISARREAESRLFLDALMPAETGRAHKSEPVELVIKIEHPSEERILEGAVAGEDAPSPQAYSNDLPPPPPPPDASLARRREAEDEIARILAAVEALPPEVRQELGDAGMAPVADAVSDMRDDPIEGAWQAVDEDEPQPGIPTDEPADPAVEAVTGDDLEDGVEAAADEAVLAEAVLAEAGGATQAETPADADPDAAADRVIARMAEQIEAEQIEAGQIEAEQGEAVADVVPVDPALVAPAPVETPTEPAPRTKPPSIGAFDLPDGMGLGFVLTGGAPAPVAEPAPRAELPEHYSLALPTGMGLGYALTRVMEGSFRVAPEPVEPEHVAAEDIAAEDVVAPEIEAVPRTEPDAEVIEPEPEAQPEPEALIAEADVETEAEADAEAEAEAQAATDVQAGSDDDGMPPHPAETPAEASGAVGEVAGEPVAGQHAAEHAALDDLDDDPMMAGHDPMADEDDEFSPRDLAADVHEIDDRNVSKSDDGLWTFTAVLIAGLFLAGFGSVLAASEWDYIMAQREMTLNFGMALAGFFLVIVAGWQLASIWLSKLKQKAGN